MKLVFIYNANSGISNALFDLGHKLFSPKTYPCRLCALTFDTFAENAIWRAFRKKHEIAMVFYHKDEFETRFPNENIIYPAILMLDNLSFSTILNHLDLKQISSTRALMKKIDAII